MSLHYFHRRNPVPQVDRGRIARSEVQRRGKRGSGRGKARDASPQPRNQNHGPAPRAEHPASVREATQ